MLQAHASRKLANKLNSKKISSRTKPRAPCIIYVTSMWLYACMIYIYAFLFPPKFSQTWTNHACNCIL
ncbi:hypothetical protein BRADI_2g07281v3 [Brachypodium distachyon]|uniref:Uncharacterized protein n=1 Tax=Brachypodium distachyon TaxID=15368 RepID=A0A2K2D7C7_BRADI|nr:hypothetical protein BRADI_2g07281v3 [Brachypodium distachyon]